VNFGLKSDVMTYIYKLSHNLTFYFIHVCEVRY